MTSHSNRVAAALIAVLGAAGLGACDAAPSAASSTQSSTTPSSTALPSTALPSTAQSSRETQAPPAVAPVDLATYPAFCTDVQSLIGVGDEFGGILAEFYEPRDLDLIHQWGGDLARLYASEVSLYTSFASAPDPRVARDAAAILTALPAADGAVAELALGATDWESFNRDLNALFDGPVFSDASSAAHVASDELWDIAYATCDSLAG
jgi:hypothetical protein